MSTAPVDTREIAKVPDGKAIEALLLSGDIERLDPKARVDYYLRVCDTLGLNPYTQPFEFLRLNGKTVFYAKKSCTEQLRVINRVSIVIAAREEAGGCYVVTARATDKTGRTDESIGAVPIEGLKGELRSNAMMKAETKAKRRVTLSICGLGLLDESETDSIPGAVRVPANVVDVTPEATPVPKAEPGSVSATAGNTTGDTPSGAPTPKNSDTNRETSDPGEAPSEEQFARLKAAVATLTWSKPKINAWFQKTLGIANINAATAVQAETIIELLAAAKNGGDAYVAALSKAQAEGRAK